MSGGNVTSQPQRHQLTKGRHHSRPQAFLPLLGAKRTLTGPPGRIIMVSSTSGKIAAPFIGAYAASKHGLEGMSESLRRELMLFGIDVIIVGEFSFPWTHITIFHRI